MAQIMGQAARALKIDPASFWGPAPTNVGNAFLNGEFEYADQTASPTLAVAGNGDFGQPMHYFRCLVVVKAFVLPTGTSPLGSTVYIEVGDNAALTTNNRKLELRRLPAIAAEAPAVPDATTGFWSMDLRGVCPDGARQFARPGVTLGTGGTTNATIAFDAFLCAAYPGSAAGSLN